MLKSTAEDYGWREIEKLSNHDYLFPIVKHMLMVINPSRLLDFGCGNGRFTRRLKETGFDVTGCDIDEHGINIANKENDGIPFFLIKERDTLEESRFDAIVAVEVIEHMFIPQELLVFAQKHLYSDGYLIITTPYHGYLKNLAISIFNLWDEHHHPLKIGGHIKFWSVKTISKLLSDNGFEIIKIAGAGRMRLIWKSMVVLSRINGV